MAQLKICGVRTASFAREAERLGAGYIGLIFAPESLRAVTTSRAREVVAALAGTARPVGVFTNAAVEKIADACADAGIGIVQLHRRARREEVVRPAAGVRPRVGFTGYKEGRLSMLKILSFQLTRASGELGEQVQQTNFAQQGEMGDVRRMRGGYAEGWTVFWLTAHFLNAAAQLTEMGVFPTAPANRRVQN